MEKVDLYKEGRTKGIRTMSDWDPEPLNRLIDQAERDGLVMHCFYQNLWFTPQELRAENAKGNFRWGPTNWETRPARAHTDELLEEVNRAQRALDDWRRRTA